MITAYLSLGSNVEPNYHILTAVQALENHFHTVCLSPIYRSMAIGFKGDPFLNLVAACETTQTPEEIYTLLRTLESKQGRIRHETPFSSRTIDIDLILYGNHVRTHTPKLPRDEILNYAFILRPLAEIAPDLRHPINGRCYAELWANFDAINQPLWPVSLVQ